ncbi:galactose-specific lectin nattectin-like [Clarias gariepinus]|uniref:galactose-specific lectin nattectin-like n=1 Tax=Clarias gariepinus TaxID=13013 RepID=UPI00234D15F3|nr:galactose-specific lectin nattectin-like [Clarias gariepinus]
MYVPVSRETEYYCVAPSENQGSKFSDPATIAVEEVGGSQSSSLKSDAVTSATTGQYPHRCPGGWLHFKGRCFKYHAMKMDWLSAEKHCLNLGAHLISIHSEEEYWHAKSFIHAQDPRGNPTWIGLSRSEKVFYWSWSDATHITFTKWNPGEPSNVPNELCVHMNWPSPITPDMDWNDISCNNRYAFVCVKITQ